MDYTNVVTYSSGSDWLDISVAGGNIAGNSTETHTVSTEVNGLSAGVYTGLIQVCHVFIERYVQNRRRIGRQG